MTEYKFANITVKVHGKHDKDKVKKACLMFVSKSENFARIIEKEKVDEIISTSK